MTGSATPPAARDAHETTRRELASARAAHKLLRNFMDSRGLWDEFVKYLKEDRGHH